MNNPSSKITALTEYKRGTAVFALILFLGLAVYGPGIASPFVFDDFTTIVDNSYIKHVDALALWRYDPSRFLTNLTFAFNYLLFGLNSVSWHVIDLILHCACAFILFKLVVLCFDLPKFKSSLRVAEKPAFALSASLIFLLHPLQTQAVLYTVQRSTLLCVLLMMTALYSYLKGRLKSSAGTWTAAIALAYAGMMTKPLFMVFPLLVALLEIYGFKREEKLDYRRAAVYFLLCLPLLIVPFFLLGLQKLNILAWSSYQTASWKDHLLTQFNVLMTYLRLLVIPMGQNLDYDYPIAHTLFAFPTFLSFLGLAALVTLAMRFYKNEPWVSLGILWFLIALSPVIIFPLNDMIFEHWLYLPMAGFASIVSRFLTPAVMSGKKAGQTAAVVILVVLSVLAYQRALIWADPEILFKDTIAKSPTNPRPYNNLGLIYLEQKRWDEAQRLFQQALALNPNYFIAYNNLAQVYLEQGRFLQSRLLLEELLRRYPNYADAYLNLAQIYERMHEDDKAMEYAYRGLEKDPLQPMAYLTLGNIYQNKKMLVQAREAYQKAIWLRPESPSVFYNLGNVYFKEGNFFEALQYYEKARKLRPDMLEAYVNAGNVYYYFGDYAAAIEQYREAIDRGTVLPEAYFNMANALHATGAVEESQKYVQRAIILYEKLGRRQEADRIRKKLEELN